MRAGKFVDAVGLRCAPVDPLLQQQQLSSCAPENNSTGSATERDECLADLAFADMDLESETREDEDGAGAAAPVGDVKLGTMASQ